MCARVGTVPVAQRRGNEPLPKPRTLGIVEHPTAPVAGLIGVYSPLTGDPPESFVHVL